MDIQSFIGNFATLFEETDMSILTPQTRYQDLEEWSSLLTISTIMLVDQQYDVAIKADQIRDANTIEELYNIVKEKVIQSEN
ncbi:MAG: acyl carrier protein [Bacteroidales bacterium]|jgi:acyl carrier protein|nr:acyl carrier protein [Bacteroidales bacterium]